VLGLLFAIGFGTLVRQELVGSIKAGPISKAALFLATIPVDIRKMFRWDLIVEDRFPDKAGFTGRPLDQEAYLLLARYDGNLEESVVELINLTTFNVLHTWNPDISHINSLVDVSNPEFKFINRDRHEKRYRIMHPLLNSDGSLFFQDHSPLIKIDYCSELVWQNQEDKFHHSNELDHEGNVWVPTSMYPYSIDEKYIGSDFGYYFDDAITKVSRDGEILFQKSLSELFIENDMKYLLFAVGIHFFQADPIHLNDIQPVLGDSDYWKKGDVFLSLVTQSMIILYRPTSNEIIWIGTGHNFRQHDVDILSDHQISIFNNNSMDTIDGSSVDGNNEVIIYDFSTNEYSTYLNKSIIERDVRTPKEGRAQILDNGDLFIEETIYSRTLYFDANGSLRWEYVNRASNGNVYLSSWSRILYHPQDVSMIRSLLERKSCNNG